MGTKLLAASPESIALGAELLRKGELVAFPTEKRSMVWARMPLTAKRCAIFSPRRDGPADNPLIVHVWSRDQLAGILRGAAAGGEIDGRFLALGR